MSNFPTIYPIPFETFAGVDIRVGTVESVENVLNSDKLMRLPLNFGDHTRQILAGEQPLAANEIHLAARFAQGLLAVTIVSAVGLVVQLSLLY